MILPIDTDPNNSLYVIGARILKELNQSPIGVFDLVVLFRKINKSQHMKMSFTQFLYGVDWLFILGLVKMKNDTQIEKCF